MSNSLTVEYAISHDGPTQLKENDTLSYAVDSENSLESLQKAIAQAAEDMNTVLTEWKDELGTSEKEKERLAERKAKEVLMAKKANGQIGAEDGSDDEA